MLAATLSPTWGIYGGYELCENTPLRDGSEEYLDSEKYQLRPRDWEAAEREGRSIAPLITALNRIRRAQPGPPAAARHPLPPDRQRRGDRVLKRTRLEHGSGGRQPRPAPHPGGHGLVGHAGTRPRLARVRPGARRAHRRDLSLGQGQLRAPRAGPRARARASASCDRPRRRSEGHPHHDRQRARPRHLRGHPRQGPRSRLVQAGRLLRGPRPLLPGQQRRRRRRPQGPHRQAGLPAVAGRRLPLAAAVLRSPRCGTAVTTSPTTPPCCPSSATSPTSWSSWTPRTSAACA